MPATQTLQKQEGYGDNMKDWLKKELDSMSQEKWDELYIKLIDRYHLPDERHKYDKKTAEGLVKPVNLHFDILAYNLSKVVKKATYEEARDLLLFALSDEVEEEGGHYLCDAALLALITELMDGSNRAEQIIDMFHSVRKWYS